MPQIYDMGPTALLPLRRKACWGFFRPKNPTVSAGFEPANLGTKGQHAAPRPPEPLSFICIENSELSGLHVSTFIRSSSGPLRKYHFVFLPSKRDKAPVPHTTDKWRTIHIKVHILNPKSKTEFLYCLLYTVGFNLLKSQIIFNRLMLRPPHRLQYIQTYVF